MRCPGRSRNSDLSTSLTLAAMSLGYGVVQFDVTIVDTALDSIGASLDGGVSELQWVVSSYTIAFAAFILTAGALGDRIGAKRIFMAGFAAASVGCALAPNATPAAIWFSSRSVNVTRRAANMRCSIVKRARSAACSSNARRSTMWRCGKCNR
jgi:DHA2 family methylenomycin A resistance protein-like MFS transporter